MEGFRRETGQVTKGGPPKVITVPSVAKENKEMRALPLMLLRGLDEGI